MANMFKGNNGEGGNMTLDLSGVDPELGFKALPAGDYAVVVDEVKFGDSKAGNPMVTWVLEVVEHPDYEGRKIWEFHTLNNEFGVKKLTAFLTKWFPDTPLEDFDPVAFAESGQAIGVTGIVKLNRKEDKKEKGTYRNNVVDVQVYDSAALNGGNVSW